LRGVLGDDAPPRLQFNNDSSFDYEISTVTPNVVTVKMDLKRDLPFDLQTCAGQQ